MIRYQRRRYKLVNTDTGNSIILDGQGTNYEPRNWDNSERELNRSTRNYSITTILSKNLEFTGAGANFLISAYNSKGVEANVKMFEERFDTPDSVPYIYSIGDFDFSDYSREKNVVKVPFNSGGLNSLIKSKINDKYELNRTKSIDGQDIDELKINEFAVINRPIYLDSKSQTSNEDKNPNELTVTFNVDENSLGVPLNIIYESDSRFVSILPNQFDQTPNVGLASTCFYYLNNIDKSFNLSIDVSFNNVFTAINLIPRYALDLVIYENGENLNLKQRISLKEYLNIEDETINEDVNVSYNNSNFTLLKDESLGLQFYVDSINLDLSTFSSVIKDLKATVQLTEFSERNDLPRRSQFVFNNEAGAKLMSIINNDSSTYYSDFFTNGNFKLSGLTSGKWIRGFTDSKISMSLKEFLDNSNALFNMGYNIEILDGKETIVHEDLRHFFRSETVIKIPQQVNKVKRTVAKEFIFSTIKTGYKRPSGDNLYEEVNGLNEFNTSNEYVTPITRLQKDYEIESPFRADSEGKELTLRKSIKEFPSEDYRTDNTIFNLDLKDVGTNVYEERTYIDDYEQEPKNVFSPETATGLRFTPFRNMQRHFWFLNNAFTKFVDKYIRYSSSKGNSELITKKVGEPEYAENGDYQINSLENPIFVSEWIEFEYKVDSELLEQVNGYTTINGRKIPNLYFKIEFINEFNQKEYGYLFRFRPLKEGKWKLLKAL